MTEKEHEQTGELENDTRVCTRCEAERNETVDAVLQCPWYAEERSETINVVI